MMVGKWLVKLNFDFKGENKSENLDIEIPVQIAE
jgi:hypothetical protein